MSFIIIEGDNASGKTTLAKALGMSVINDFDWFIEKEQQLKTLPLEEKIKGFLVFNKKCGIFGHDCRDDRVLVRYWPSTVASSYADGLLDYEDAKELARQCLEEFPKPKASVFLICQDKIRINRIMARRKETFDMTDSLSVQRHKRYRQILDYIRGIMPNVILMDTTNTTIQESSESLQTRLSKE